MRPTRGSDFTYTLIKTLRSDQLDKANSMDLMVVLWRRSGVPVLEKRRVYHLANGEIRMRKLVGMNASDVEYIVAHADEIKTLLEQGEGDGRQAAMS